MTRDGVHHNREGQDVTTHDKDQEEYLCCAEDFTSNGAGHDFTCISHVVNMGVCELELADDEASVGREDPEACDENDTAARTCCQ